MSTEANSKAITVPTVSRVCRDQTLIDLVYDPDARKTALAASRFGGLWNLEQEVRVETGEILVPYSPRNNLILNECILLPSRPVEHGHKEELVADIRAFVHRYVDLSPLFETIAAHYVLLTWVHDAFTDLPYLRLRGNYGSGKTRGLMVIGSICYKGFFASGASTVSPIFHTLDTFGGTLILDEADLPFSDARTDIVKILNNGTVQGMPVLRTVVNRHKEFNPKAFKVFGPKIVAMRGAFADEALESRFLTEETGTRQLRSDIPVHLPAQMKAEALELRNRLLHFRLCHFFKMQTDVSALMQGVDPRVNQTALSLLSVIDDLALRKEVQQALIEEDAARQSERQDTAEARVLAATRDAFAASQSSRVPLREITERFNSSYRTQYGSEMTHRWIGHILRKQFRVRIHKSKGIYVLDGSERAKVEALAANMGL